MQKTLSLFFLCLWSLSIRAADGEQWASQVVKYSSQAGSKGYSARQVLGRPNALQYGKNPVAWAPEAPNLGLEYVEVGFDRPGPVQQVAIFENFNPGAIYQIYLIEPSGKYHQIYQQDQPVKAGSSTRIFRHFFQMTRYNVIGVKLVLNTAGTYGLNQIDAIGISSGERPMEADIRIPEAKGYTGKPENLGYEVNSEDPDMLPILSVDGQTLYFARKHHIDNMGAARNDDIYVSRRTNKGGWTEAYNIGAPLNNEYNNFVCAVNPDGTELLLSGRYTYRGAVYEGLHRASFSNGKWQEPRPIHIEGYRNLSPFVCYHVSPDMKYLVIAMEHPDTYGDMDIYVSFRQSDDRYSRPQNLGPVINTAGTEPSVFLSADGKTIYFASDGHPGYGAYDMYMSRRLDNSWKNWSEPINLGPEINSPDWDLYYTVPSSGEYAYFSSEKNSFGKSDLYRIPLPKEVRPEPVVVVQPAFIDIRTKTPVAELEKQNKTIVLSDDSRISLYEEVKGYYPVNASPDLSAELEEVDDFSDGSEAADDPLDQRMEDLLKRLQELKKEEAKTEKAWEDVVESRPAVSYETDVPAANTDYTSDLDDRLAALRSDMDRIAEGKAPVNSSEDPSAAKTYRVKPGMKDFEKTMEEAEATRRRQDNWQEQQDRQADALDDFRDDARYRNTTPRPTADRRFDVPDREEGGFQEEHRDYRDRLEQLKSQRDKTATAPQPLTREVLQRTAIDDETEDQLVANSLSSELDRLRSDKHAESHTAAPVNPEVAAYQRKLDALKADRQLPEVRGNLETVTTSDVKDGEEETPDEEVLAFQQKLEEMKARMNQLPETGGASASTAPIPPAPVSDPVATTPGKHETTAERRRDRHNREADTEVETVAVVNRKTETEPEKVKEMPDHDTALLSEKTEVATDEVEPVAAIGKAVDPDELAALEAANDRLKAEQEELARQRAEMQAELHRLEAERKSFLEEKERLEKERRQLEEKKQQQQDEVRALEEEIAALEEETNPKNIPVETADINETALPDNELFLMPIEEGVTFEIRNIFFNANSAYIKPISYEELGKVVDFLEVNSHISVEIGGHTNGLCTDDFCNSLSQRRAKAVADYLESKGVSGSRLTFKGYGKSQPVASNNTNEGRKKNQRVELKIVKIEQ